MVKMLTAKSFFRSQNPEYLTAFVLNLSLQEMEVHCDVLARKKKERRHVA
jgi:hypothetical protein